MAGKRVGIMCGTFNPIHLGQMIIAENACELFNLDEVLFVPRGDAFYKEDMLDEKTRINLVGIAIEDNPNFALSTLEVERGNSYTCETIETLKQKNPDNTYFLIVGADTFVEMGSWKNVAYDFNEVTVLVANRLGTSNEEVVSKANEYKDKYNAKIELLPISCVDISSKDIRTKVRENKSIRYMVHYKVIEYIKKNNLYKEVQ